MRPGRKPTFTAPVKERFLEVLSQTASVTKALRACHVVNSTAYRHKNEDPEFAAAWQAALDTAVDLLEAEAWRRAYDGVDKPIYHKGERIDVIKEYSDDLIKFLLRANKPEKYGDRLNLGATLPKGGSIKFEMILAAEGQGNADN